MNATMAPPQRHVHVDLDVDPEQKFHYRSQGGDGHRVLLHRGDSVTFTCVGEFSIWFAGASPFEAGGLHSRHSFITTHVRSDATTGAYPYSVEVMQGDNVLLDPPTGGPVSARPEIVIEN